MSNINIAFADLINGPTVVPGAGGWDATLNQFIANMRGGMMNFGLLGRLMNMRPQSGSTGSALVVAEPGWWAMPYLVGIQPINSAESWSGKEISITVGSPAGTENPPNHLDWAGNGGSDPVDLSDLFDSNGQPKMICVQPSPTAVGSHDSFSPQAFPILDGDHVNLFKLCVINESGTPPLANYFCWGAAWPKSDA